MNIRLSLKMMFGTGMVLFGAIMAYVFFVFAFDLYVQGRDDSVLKLMVEAARTTDISQDDAVSAMGFTVTSDWADVPNNFKTENPVAPATPFELRKFYRFPDAEPAPEEIVYVLMVPDQNDVPIYISKSLTSLGMELGIGEPDIDPYNWTILVGVLTAVAFSLLLLVTLHFLVRPLESLQAWAESLTVDDLQSPAPSFKYKEFSRLAEIIRTSLTSVNDSLKKEQEFLQYASHELRSPLAAIRSNLDLMMKKHSQEDPAKLAIFQRLDRATQTMSQLIQTLLWLYQDQDRTIDEESIALDELTAEVVDEAKYLCAGKEIEIQLSTSPHTMTGSRSAMRIAVANLVRNALQHTEAGIVSISQSGASVEIHNPVIGNSRDKPATLGFGLGIKLITKLSDQCGWVFKTSDHSDNFVSVISF